MKTKGKRIALATGAITAAVLGVAAFLLKDIILEEAELFRLGLGDGRPERYLEEGGKL